MAKERQKFDQTFIDVRGTDQNIQGEAEYILTTENFNVIAGSGVYDVDRHSTSVNDLVRRDSARDSTIYHKTAYLYSNINVLRSATITLGVSGDDYDQEKTERTDLSPKIGLLWDFNENVRVRAAAFRSVKPALVANASIQPMQIAGFNQFFDDINGTDAWRYGIGVDLRLSENLSAGVEASRRIISEPVDVSTGSRRDRRENLYRSYVYWTPDLEWVLGGELIIDRHEIDKEVARTTDLSLVQTWTVPVSAIYFSPLGVFAGATGSYVTQKVNRRDRNVQRIDREGDNGFFVLDAFLGYRFPQRRGLVSVEVSNILDASFKYQDDSFRSVVDQEQPIMFGFIPERAILCRVTLNF